MVRFGKISKLILLFVFFLIFTTYTTTVCAGNTLKTTSDPTRIGVGARVLGMGKAFVGLADDSTAMFINPAGIAQLKSWQATSMSAKLLGEIDYLTIGGVYPTEDYGVFGFGYVSGSMYGSNFTNFELVEDELRFYVESGKEAINYISSVMLLSYGNEVDNVFGFDFLGLNSKDLMFGVNLKMFSQELTGISDGGTAKGMDMDFGFLHHTTEWMTLGLSLINILPVDSGGKLVTDTDVEHSIPATIKFGPAITLLGPKGLYESEQTLTYLLDIDSRAQNPDYPTLVHTGFEYWPTDSLALRLGIDQDVIGKSATGEVDVESNLAMGVGFMYNDFRVDYAYHQYGGIQDNDTTYVSISYGFGEPIAVKEVPKTYFEIIAPSDKNILYKETIKIIGLAANLDIVDQLTINDVEIPISQDGSFEVASKLNLGKNVFEVKAFDNDGKLLKKEKIRILRLIKFKDIKDDYWAKRPVEFLAVLGMVGGYPDGTFRPDNKITRAELTTLLVRAKGYKLLDVKDKIFGDLPKVHWAAKYVHVGVGEKLVTGYPDGTFRPKKSINRAEGVILLSRFAELELPELLVEGPYEDLPGRHWAAKAVSAAKTTGMLAYLGSQPFLPKKDLSRAEAVEMLSKTPFAAAKIDDLLDFDTY